VHLPPKQLLEGKDMFLAAISTHLCRAKIEPKAWDGSGFLYCNRKAIEKRGLKIIPALLADVSRQRDNDNNVVLAGILYKSV